MILQASKLPTVGTTIFTVMSQLAEDCDAINLSQGFPDFQPPSALVNRVNHHLNHGKNQYAPMAGVLRLRQQISRKIANLYKTEVDPETEVTITSGATEALFSAIQAIVQPGDEVIVFDPSYDSYEPAITLAGGRTIHLPLMAPGFKIDWQQVGDKINPNTRLLVINSPHNPTGAILGCQDLDTLASLLRDTSILVLSDEVYEHIVFDKNVHHSVLSHEELQSRSFAVSSFGKTYHATGWKVGYCVAPKTLTQEFRKVHQFNCFSVVTPIQHALADFMASNSTHHLELPGFYQTKRDRFCELMKNSRFSFVPTQGTYFQLLDYSSLSEETDVDYATRLTREVGVASIPISVFCQTEFSGRFLRFCFAKDDETLQKATNLLCQI